MGAPTGPSSGTVPCPDGQPSTVRLGHGVFLQGRLHATAESVRVFIDTQSRGSIAVPPSMRAALEGLRPLRPPQGALGAGPAPA